MGVRGNDVDLGDEGCFVVSVAGVNSVSYGVSKVCKLWESI